MNSWQELPNAENINRVLVSLKSNPGKWSAAQYDANGFVNYKTQADTYLAARTICNDMCLTSALEEALNTAWNNAKLLQNAYLAAANAIVALIVYPESDLLLDHDKPWQVKKAAADGHEQATLMLPAVLAFE